MIIRPCYWCLFESDCMKRRMIERKIKQVNHGILIFTQPVKINCKLYYEQFEPGERVIFKHQVVSGQDDAGVWGDDASVWEFIPEWIHGTFMRWKSRKALVWLDEPHNGKEIIAIHPKNHIGRQSLGKLNENKIPVCVFCGKPKGKINKFYNLGKKEKLNQCYSSNDIENDQCIYPKELKDKYEELCAKLEKEP